jgi:hypothetical protein
MYSTKKIRNAFAIKERSWNFDDFLWQLWRTMPIYQLYTQRVERASKQLLSVWILVPVCELVNASTRNLPGFRRVARF